jgi:hypothetical protein
VFVVGQNNDEDKDRLPVQILYISLNKFLSLSRISLPFGIFCEIFFEKEVVSSLLFSLCFWMPTSPPVRVRVRVRVGI